MTNIEVKLLAEAFASEVRNALTSDELLQVIERNRNEERDDCAANDFTVIREHMNAAWRKVFGGVLISHSKREREILQKAASDLARINHYWPDRGRGQ